MNDATECVIYCAPKSAGFGHQSRFRDARAGWTATQRFLEAQTHFRLLGPPRLELYGVDFGIAAPLAQDRFMAAQDIFGAPTGKVWELTEAQLPNAIAFALDDDCWPRQQIGPAFLTFAFEFTWKHFPLSPAQNEASSGNIKLDSSLGVILGNHRLFVQPGLLIPFPYDSPRTAEFLKQIELQLPFRLRDQYFQRLLPSKKGRYGRTLRLPKGWRACAGKRR